MQIEDLPRVRLEADKIAAGYYPELIPDIDREVQLLRSLVLDSSQYAAAVGPAGVPEAALVAKVGTNLWATRKHATVLLWYSHRPGAGFALLRDFRDWVKKQNGIVLAGFMDDFDMDTRMVPALKRAGFVKRGGAYCHFPRGAKK